MPRSYGGQGADSRISARRSALLAAGRELMGTVGTDRTTMTAVCAAAGLTERYFYESFSGKADLVVAVVDALADEVRDTARRALETTEGSEIERVRAALTAVVTLLLDDPRKGRIAVVESIASAELRVQRHRTLAGVVDFVSAAALTIWGPRAVVESQRQLAGMMLVGACTELLLARLEGTRDLEIDDIVDAATALFVATTRRD
ncbi:TetR/AcrR family transcriptional regulator [Rhodococcoides corynebacterioides]|uniref:TetR/AcrR family transcriptional regulator n=1 Tax=Rhodococcoides corynebacterioides TaxID=53972 RepID=UPI003F818808